MTDTSEWMPSTRNFERDGDYEDATEPLTIHVTQADIDAAVPGSSRNCAISRAANREYGCFDIQIFRTRAYVRFNVNEPWKRYSLSRSTCDVIITFDASGRTKPICVTFRVVNKASRLETTRSEPYRSRKNESDRKYRDKKKGERRVYTKPNPLTLFGVRNGTGQSPRHYPNNVTTREERR